MSDEQNQIENEEAQVDEENESLALYTCAPTKSLKFGKFQFENGLLRLVDPDDVEEFEFFLSKASTSVKSVVKKISLEAADKIAREHTNPPEAFRGTQTTASMKLASQIAKDSDKRVTEPPQPPATNPRSPESEQPLAPPAPQTESGNEGGAGQGNSNGGIGPLTLKS